jgi:hypothetical protein
MGVDTIHMMPNASRLYYLQISQQVQGCELSFCDLFHPAYTFDIVNSLLVCSNTQEGRRNVVRYLRDT